MRRLLIFLLFFCLSCGDNSKLGSIEFNNYIDSYDLRIFSKEDVSSEFLKNVGKAYEAMFDIILKLICPCAHSINQLQRIIMFINA